MNYFTESNSTWHYCYDNDSTLNPEQGFDYWVTYARTVEFTGKLTAIDQSPTISYTSSPHGYNLIGNPFSSAIKWDASWPSSDLEGTIWIWDSAYNGGDYRTVTTAGVGSLNDNIIPIGQAFFVHGLAASPSVTIPAGAREHHLQTYYKNSEEIMNKNISAFAMLKVIKDERANDVWISFSENATDGFDNGWDATKFIADGSPGLFIPQGEFELAINTLPLLEDNVGRTVAVSLLPCLMVNIQSNLPTFIECRM